MATVRVKIAVVVNEDGHWSAHGDSICVEKNSILDCQDRMPGERVDAIYWVEADIPIPQAVAGTVQGIVKPADGK